MSVLHTSPQPPLHTSAQVPATDRRSPRAARRRKTMLVVVAALLAAAAALSVGVNATASSLGAHEHGTLDIRIDGDAVDLDQPRFHELHPEFHVHPGHGNLWHHHPENATGILTFEPMTLAEALHATGIELTDEAFAFDGTVHRLTHPQGSVVVKVNGTQVDPDAHVIADGDAITVEVVTGG